MNPTEAKRIYNWQGMVYSETFFNGRGHVFKNVYEFQYFIYEECQMDAFLEKPSFIWPVKEARRVQLHFTDAVYLATGGMDAPHAKGLTQLEAAIEQFNAENSPVVFVPDYTMVIQLDWEERVQKKPKPTGDYQ